MKMTYISTTFKCEPPMVGAGINELKDGCWYRSVTTGVKEIALHVVKPSSISGITHSALNTTGR